MSNQVPDGWSIHRQGDVSDFSNGRAFKLDEWEKEGTPVIRLQNLTGTGKEFYYSNLKLPERQYCKSGDLLYMWSATFGPYIWNGPKAIYHYHIWKVTPNELDLTKNYAFQLLGFKTDEWLNKSNGMGILHVTKGNMEELLLTLPPLPEQKKIAAILSSVDKVIEKTRAQIDKLKDLKTGMMQELLTQGIGHTEFKNSPMGRIPASWETGSLEFFGINVLDGDRGKEYPKGADFYTWEHCLFLSAKNVTKAGFKFDETAFITKEKDNALRKGKLVRGDVVITTRGTVGNTAFYGSGVPFDHIRINSGMAIIRNPKNGVNPAFLNLLMDSPMVREQVELLTFGSAQPQLTIGIIKGLLIPKPNLSEQKEIADSIASIASQVNIKTNRLRGLTHVKKAMMQDLLTGKVRVHVDTRELAKA